MIGYDLGLAGLDGVEEVAIGNKANSLIPGVVAGREVGGHVIIWSEFIGHHFDHALLHVGGFLARHVEEEHSQQHVLPTSDPIGQLARKELANGVGELVDRRTRGHERR